MEIITSKQNNYIKEAKSLQEKSVRKQTNCFLVEGYKIIDEAFKAHYKIEKIFCLDKNYEQAKKFCKQIIVVNETIIKYLSTTVSPQGIIAIVREKDEKVKLNYNDKFLILDTVQNPDNLGAIIRSATAFGINHIFLFNCCDYLNEKVIRCSMGNQFKISLKNIPLCDIEKLAENRIIYCAEMNGENVCNIKFETNCGLVIGNEGNGVSKEVLKFCKKSVRIPMQNNVESLNAAISASILMFEMSKRQKEI